MTFLCEGKKDSHSRQTHSNIVESTEGRDTMDHVIDVQPNMTKDGIILPTFTAQIENGESLRVFRDTGSMRNFILSEYAEKMKFLSYSER